MENKEYLEHLKGIKGLMEERIKFKAISGLSGVFAGVYALIGAWLAYRLIYDSPEIIYDDIRQASPSVYLNTLVLIAVGTLVSAVGTGLFFSSRNARKNQIQLWNKAFIKLIINFSIPMAMGGIFILALLWRGYFSLVSSSCLIFYGLGLINASNFTFSDIKALGIATLVTGSISLFFPGYGLYFWAFGFGILHIIYGIIMYIKYEK